MKTREEIIEEGESLLQHGLRLCFACNEPKVQRKGETCIHCTLKLERAKADDRIGDRLFVVVYASDGWRAMEPGKHLYELIVEQQLLQEQLAEGLRVPLEFLNPSRSKHDDG